MSLIEKISRDFPVGNAAGECKTLEEVRNLVESAVQFIVVGSITVQHRDGNPGNTFNNHSLNSLGLPNLGAEYIRRVGKEMVKVAHNADKSIVLSIAGFSPEEYFKLANVAVECGFDGLEVNAGCPNIVDGGKRKEIISFDHCVLNYIVMGVLQIAKRGPRVLDVWVKVSPMSNPADIPRTATLLALNKIDVVVLRKTPFRTLSPSRRMAVPKFRLQMGQGGLDMRVPKSKLKHSAR
jgi:dihydroorotate dehydrogenase (fumarate)